MWITFYPCGKERTFVEKIARFYQNRSLFLEVYPRIFFFQGVIHKNRLIFLLCTIRLWTSYPPIFAPFSLLTRGKPDLEKCAQVIHGILIHFFKKSRVDNPVLSTF